MRSGENFYEIIGNNLAGIILAGVFLASISFLFLVATQKNFKATTDFLVVQNEIGNQDFYTTAKSTEHIGKILSEAVYSDIFIDQIISGDLADKEFLPFDKIKRMKEWSRRVNVGGNFSVGMISVTVFDNNKNQAIDISKNIGRVFSEKNELFRGKDQKIDVRVISGPTVEKNPTVSGIAAVIFGGFLMGVLLAIIWFFYFPPRKNYTDPAMSNFMKNNPDEYERSLRGF